MANRRMFSIEIVNTDAFLNMPTSTRLLYYDLGMRADDDGFLQNAQNIARCTGASFDDLRLLAAKGYVIPFENGVVVVRHWHVNNQLRKDRYKPTLCRQEKSCLLLSGSGVYERSPVWQPDGNHTEKRLSPWQPNGNQAEIQRTQGENTPWSSCWQPDGNQMETQVRLGKVSVVEEVEEECNSAPASAPADPPAGLLSFEEIASRRDNIERAEQLIRRHRLPDGDLTMDALLEDAERYGWDKLEEALRTASLSNSRKGLSVNFYRSVLSGMGRSESPHGGDPYAGYASI